MCGSKDTPGSARQLARKVDEVNAARTERLQASHRALYDALKGLRDALPSDLDVTFGSTLMFAILKANTTLIDAEKLVRRG